MPTPLNLQARGLLEFFGIKSGEWGPRELGQTLLPTMELARWYMDPAAIEVFWVVGGGLVVNTGNGSFNITLTSPIDLTNGVTLQVPQTEQWWLLEASITWGFDNAPALPQFADFSYSTIGQIGGVAHRLPMDLEGFTASSANVARGGVRYLPRPFLLLPGMQLLWRTFGAEGASAADPISVVGTLRILRTRI